ncbi:MAG: Holliday junction resolvase RuvX [Acidobacteriia bacterium]|nr:Holliday junction resolvase RuvX [Terriglobia bacterium]
MEIPHRAAPSPATSHAMGVILAIDYGKKRLGLALSDESGVTSRPFATWERTNRRRDLGRLRDLVRDERVRRIVVGLPLHLDGSPSEMSEEVKGFSERVRKALGIPVDLMDERLSSWEARQTISAAEPRRQTLRGSQARIENRKKTPLDDVAAAIILRDYLQRARRQDGARD